MPLTSMTGSEECSLSLMSLRGTLILIDFGYGYLDFDVILNCSSMSLSFGSTFGTLTTGSWGVTGESTGFDGATYFSGVVGIYDGVFVGSGVWGG